MKVECEVVMDYYQERRESRIRSAFIVVGCLVLIGVICLVSSCIRQPIPA